MPGDHLDTVAESSPGIIGTQSNDGGAQPNDRAIAEIPMEESVSRNSLRDRMDMASSHKS